MDVLRVGDGHAPALARLLGRYDLKLRLGEDGDTIPGSHWGEPEAGLIGHEVFARADTPVHSVLHEAAHVICMEPARRARLDTDADPAGDDLEESAVCYLQLRLGEELAGVGLDRLATDMDRWGYSFRLGSTRAWLEGDASDARAWLLERDLLDADDRPTWRPRSA